MSTFTNDTGNVSVNFSIQFDLTSTPKLKVTDNSTYSAAQSGVSILVKVTRPDGIIIKANEGGDIKGDSGSLNTYEALLPLSPIDGQVSKGTYKIEYSFSVDNSYPVIVTKSIDYDFKKIDLTTFQDINEFTPLIKLKDTTPSYDVSNYSLGSINRLFIAQNSKGGSSISNVTNTGTTNADREFSLADTSSKFYDTKYIVDLEVTLIHTHSTYSWFSVKSKSTKRDIVKVFSVPTKLEMISYFNSLRNLVETYDGYNKALYDKYAKEYEFVITSFDLLVRRLDAELTDDDNTDILRDILDILRNNIPRTHTQIELGAVDLQIYATVSVNWKSIEKIPVYNPFESYEQIFATASLQWDITHGLGKKPSVTLVDDNENIVYGAIEYVNLNVIKITFNKLSSGKAYLN
jgi:hypothetical protein|tara:strand:- start:193 stop:1407 length:1215 start_codon:yes stop_codon:yes gene_type:complete